MTSNDGKPVSKDGCQNDHLNPKKLKFCPVFTIPTETNIIKSMILQYHQASNMH